MLKRTFQQSRHYTDDIYSHEVNYTIMIQMFEGIWDLAKSLRRNGNSAIDRNLTELSTGQTTKKGTAYPSHPHAVGYFCFHNECKRDFSDPADPYPYPKI